MKELIEKTFEKVTDEFAKRGVDVFSQDTYLVVNKYKNVLLRELEEQELKKFNPIECGFILNDSFNKEYPYKVYYNEDKQGYFEIADCGNNSFKLTGIQPLIKIPNHRQGVELLRNLGVIDAD